MASSSREKPEKMQGIRIDSSLISTGRATDTHTHTKTLSLSHTHTHTAASGGGEVESELEGLGVSVFDQGTFEEGVMRQLDQEMSRQAAEQRRKFLIQDYSRVQQEKK